MRSSALVFARAMVMLAFLVALPAFAIFGANPWEAVRGLILPTPAEEPLPEAPPFHPLASAPRRAVEAPIASVTPGEPVTPPTAPSTLPPRGDQPAEFSPNHDRPEFQRPLPNPPSYSTEPPPWRSQPGMVQQPAGAPNAGQFPPVAQQPPHASPVGPPAGTYESTPYPEPQPRDPAAEFPSRSAEFPPRNVDPAVQPARAEWPVTPAPTGPESIVRPSPERPAEPNREPSEFQAIQQRLQSLGATYYRLETWGQKNQFRFQCRMAVRENTHFARQFEATDPDPVLAMRRVLEQVERWRVEHPLQQ